MILNSTPKGVFASFIIKNKDLIMVCYALAAQGVGEAEGGGGQIPAVFLAERRVNCRKLLRVSLRRLQRGRTPLRRLHAISL